MREQNDEVVFLHKVLPGGTDKSYGVQVARLAGVPKPVIARAKEVLRVLEESELNLQALMSATAPVAGPDVGAAPAADARPRPPRRLQSLAPSNQMDLFLGR